MAELRFDNLEDFDGQVTNHDLHLAKIAREVQEEERQARFEEAQAAAEPAATPADSVVATSDSFVEEVNAQGDSGPSELSSLDNIIDALNLARTVLKTAEIPKPPIPAVHEAPPEPPAPAPAAPTSAPPVAVPRPMAPPVVFPRPSELRPSSRPSTGWSVLSATSPQGLPLNDDLYPEKLERNPIHKALLAWSRQLTWKGWN